MRYYLPLLVACSACGRPEPAPVVPQHARYSNADEPISTQRARRRHAVPASQAARTSELAAPASEQIRIGPAGEAHPARVDVEPSEELSALVVVEEPFKQYERPRLEGAIQAAGQDEELARWNVGGNGDPSFISKREEYHPGARVVVDTKLMAGRLPRRSTRALSQAGVLAQSRSRGYWPFRICYEDALRRDPKQRGESRLRLTIARSGRVTRVHLLNTELDRSGGECLRRAAQKLAYQPGPRAGLVAFDLSVKFWPGDAPVPSTGPPVGTNPINPGQLDVAGLYQVAQRAVHRVRECYRAGLDRDPELWGRVELLLHLASDGTLRSVVENESSFPDAEVSRCVIAAVSDLDYPPVRGGELKFIQAFRLGSPAAPASQAPESSEPGTTLQR